MSGFPWNSFFISIGPLAGALGGVWIRGRQDTDREQGRAVRARQDAHRDRCGDAYAELVTTARLVLRNQKQLGIAFATRVDTEHQTIQDVFARGSDLLDDLNRAVVIVAITGSAESRSRANAVFGAIRTCSDIITAHSAAVYARRTGTGSGATVSGTADLIESIATAEAALEEFLDAVRPELAPA